jgi:hypothetical protein
MNKHKLEAKVLAALQDQLRSDETVEVVTQVFKDLGPALMVPVLALAGQLETRRYGVVLTNQRLIFVATSSLNAKMLGIAAEYPRRSMRVLTPPKGVYRAFDIVGPNGTKTRLSFPVPNRLEGEKIATALAGAIAVSTR